MVRRALAEVPAGCTQTMAIFGVSNHGVCPTERMISMYNMKHLAKFKKMEKVLPEGLKAFMAFGTTERKLTETTLIAAALRAGGAMTHGTHTLE